MNALLQWVGGKRLLRKQIIPMIPADIKGYIEPFGGAAWILLAKDKWANLEVYNDLDGELTNLFRIVKYHIDALVLEMAFLISSRTFFDQMKANQGFTDIQKAARFLYLIKRSFGGMGRNYGYAVYRGGAGFTSHRNILLLAETLHERLDKVIIENKDFSDIIRIYDYKDNFFYIDPPYFKGSNLYERTPKFDHLRLAEILPKIKGRWLLSIDDRKEAYDLFGGFKIKAVQRQKGIDNISGKNRIFKELLIKNF